MIAKSNPELSAPSGGSNAERDPLLAPARRQIHQALETEAARQSTGERRNDKGRVEKSERQRLPDRSLRLLLAIRNVSE